MADFFFFFFFCFVFFFQYMYICMHACMYNSECESCYIASILETVTIVNDTSKKHVSTNRGTMRKHLFGSPTELPLPSVYIVHMPNRTR